LKNVQNIFVIDLREGDIIWTPYVCLS